MESKETRRSLFAIAGILLAMHLFLLIGLGLAANLNYPLLPGLAMLAYGFGLRHSVDPDHIAAIDNVTRKLMQDGKRPTAVGFFFALGHSTVVLVVSALICLSASLITTRMAYFQSAGSLIGTTTSCVFLLLIGTINLIVLIDTIKAWRKIKNGDALEESSIADQLNNRGVLSRILRPLMKMVDNSWQMYWIGLLFGLGFDTASEIALLSMTGSTGANAVPFYLVMILPLAFTAGMSMIDTLDGVFMLGAYGWAFLKPARKLYYNMCITSVSVFVALVIGAIEGMQLLSQKTGQSESFFAFANGLQIGNWGFYIIGIFVLSWIGSMLIYRLRGYDRIGESAD